MNHNDVSRSSILQPDPAGPDQIPEPESRYTPAFKNAVFLALIALYLIVFVCVARLTSPGMAATSAIVLVVAAAWRFGAVVSVITGLLSLPCNILVLFLMGEDWHAELFTNDVAVIGTVFLMLIGVIVGRLHTLHSRLSSELAVRRRNEAELARHRDRLNELVQQRTAELEAANLRLQEEARERKSAIEELSITKEYLEDMITNSLDAIVVADSDGSITQVNRAFLDLTGNTAEKVLGQPIGELSKIGHGSYLTATGETVEIGRSFTAAAEAARARLYAEGRIQNWEHYLVCKNKVLVPVEENIILLTDSQGSRKGLVGILRDITHRKRTENELKRHRDHLNDLVQEKTAELSTMNEKLAESNRLLLENERLLKEAQYVARLGNWEWNYQTGATRWSDQFYRILGYEPAEVISGIEVFFEHIHPDDREMLAEAHMGFDFNNPYLEREFRIITKSGDVRHVASHVWSESDSDGNVMRFFGTVQDMTARKAVEEELKKREVILKDAQAIAHVANWERDLMADSNYWSDEYYRILGYEPGEIEPTFETFFNHIHPDDQNKFFNQHMTGDIIDLDFRIIQKSGRERYVTALAKVDTGHDGMPERVHGVLMDITERKTAEEELRRYQNELEELVRERTGELEAAQRELVQQEKLSVLGRLTATVSHELRNPLGVIRSSIFYLQKKLHTPDEKTGKHLRRIEEQISICDSIVDELLEFTRGRQSEMLPGDLGKLLHDIEPLVSVPDGVQLVWQAGTDLPCVGLDHDKMQRVFINLVQNAIQAVAARSDKDSAFRPRISVSAETVDEEVCVRVRDNGIGMDAETVHRAFEPLFTTRARGTGLGLSIVQKIVQEHNGTVELQSTPEGGTTVTVRLPEQAAEGATA